MDGTRGEDVEEGGGVGGREVAGVAEGREEVHGGLVGVAG